MWFLIGPIRSDWSFGGESGRNQPLWLRSTARLARADAIAATHGRSIPCSGRSPSRSTRERAHRLTDRGAEAAAAAGAAAPSADPDRWRSRSRGSDFPNPVGLAAGFDKDRRGRFARCSASASASSRMRGTADPGFGRQAGNPPQPRLFRFGWRGPGGDQPDGLQQSRPGARRWRGSRDATGARHRRGQYRRQQGQRRPDRRLCRRASGRWRRSPTISPSTSPRPTRRACARCRTRARSTSCCARCIEARGGRARRSS